jgi:hypothetical protein
MQFFKAEIFHARQGKWTNKFRYRGLYMDFWLAEEEQGHHYGRFFSWESFNLFSFYKRDHGGRDGSSLRDWAKEQLCKAGIDNFNGQIKLTTMPRLLGYVFNPVSFWHCYEKDHLVAVICEVNNTFGESHNYVVQNPLENKEAPMEKVFHVSPFYSVKGRYRFNFTKKDFVSISYESEHGPFIATLKGSPIEEGSWPLLKLFLSNPLYTFFVVFLIHYQALRLFIKRVPFYPKPKQGFEKTTYKYLREEL